MLCLFQYYLDIRYEAGDHVAVYPTNDSALVDRIGELLDVDLDEVISLVNVDGQHTLLIVLFNT